MAIDFWFSIDIRAQRVVPLLNPDSPIHMHNVIIAWRIVRFKLYGHSTERYVHRLTGEGLSGLSVDGNTDRAVIRSGDFGHDECIGN